jgi:hypothetical protein
MRKISIAIIGLFTFAFFSATALAISGACSYHGGVDCSAGPSIGGNAQCNDGWISSVPYSEIDECQSNDFNPFSMCDSSIPQMLCSTSSLQSYENILNQFQQSCEVSSARTGGSSATCSNPTLTNEIQTCQQEIQTYQQWEQSYNSCIATAKNYMIAEYQAALAASCDSQNYISGNQCLPLPANAHANSAGGYQCDTGYQSSNGGCVPPPNSYVANGIDLCNAGYIANPYHQCVTATPYQDPALGTYCQQIFGYGSIVQNGSCGCAVGYEMNSSQTQCVTVPVATSSPDSLPTPTIAATSTPSIPVQALFVINANLQLGSSGANVVNLQKFLESKGFLTLPAGTSAGYFGSLTKQSLIAYQASVSLPATGYCGSMTRTLINNSSD